MRFITILLYPYGYIDTGLSTYSSQVCSEVSVNGNLKCLCFVLACQFTKALQVLFDGGSGTGKTFTSNVFATVSAMVADDVDLVTMVSI